MRKLFPDLSFVSAKDPTAQPALQKLNVNLLEFYNDQSMEQYFKCAHMENENWNERSFQRILHSQVKPGMRILDVGCGSAHAFDNLKDLSPIYTGIDLSKGIIKRNRKKYGTKAKFISTSIYDTGLDSESFDLVFSLFVMEHLVWPHRCLAEMVRIVKPGGILIVICPNYRLFGRMPSLCYGKQLPLREKIRQKKLLYALYHIYLRTLYYPIKIKKQFPSERYPFLINLDPSCLTGKWYVDNDAVYLVDKLEIKQELENLGAQDITNELLLMHHKKLTRDNSICFAAARKKV